MGDSSPIEIVGDMFSEDEAEYDVVIVGAGISGLTAANELRKRAPDLKAKDRVGGRTFTTKIRSAGEKLDDFDLGGQWVGRRQTHILEVLQELGLETYEQFDDGLKVAQLGISKKREYSSSLPSSSLRHYTLFEVFDFVRSTLKIDYLMKRITPLNLFHWHRAAELDEETVSKWAKQNSYTRAVQDAIDVAIRSVYGVEANRMSMLFNVYYSQTAGGFLNLCEVVGDGAQAMRVKGGTQQISTRLAEPFVSEDALQLNKAVGQIKVHEQELTATVLVYDAKARDPAELVPIRTRRVILAVPPSLCGRIRFEPEVPSLKKRLFQSATPGNLIKFIATFQKAFWREKGYSGEIVSTGRTTTPGEVLPVISTYDACTSNGSPAIVGFIAIEYADTTKEERCNAVIKDLMRFLGDEALTQFVDYEEKLWSQEPFSGGCPVDYMPPGQMDAFQTIRDPFHTVHFAGTESATHWMGYMSGAVQAGRRAAHEVLHNLGRDAVINGNYLTDSIYGPEYVVPVAPCNGYIERISPWWRRIFFFSALCFGVFAYSRKYNLSMTAKAVRPTERALLGWFGTWWP
ncbi:unnamed protein product, partial [Mesorhabditis spiculigera]